MSFPKLSDQQIARVIQQVATYIEQQRQIYRGAAAPLDGRQSRAMRPFFGAPAVNSTRAIVLSGQRASNPPFYIEFIKMGFEAGSLPDLALMKAITLLDTVISHEPLTDKLLFHELVHVVQYQKLGIADFATKYVTGFLRSGGSYESIPLEMNAYELIPLTIEKPVRWIAARGLPKLPIRPGSHPVLRYPLGAKVAESPKKSGDE